ncbi:MAG: hypothetical protein H7Y59_01495 [Anaerolineales bacterium]|nr:hypothetical protein [Anaerolineales bacterium]
MKRRWIIITFLLIIAFAISFLSRNVVQQAILTPLAYLWWLLNLYYRAIPQWIVWALLVVIVFVSALRNIPLKNPFRRAQKKNQRPTKGPIEDLSQMFNKAPGGIYYKWLIANRLGNVARELLDQREGRRARGFARLIGRDWQPPTEVSAYLESGLNGSFSDFPQSYWARPQSTPLDMNASQVIEYLEYEMETRHDRNRKSI